MDDPMIGGVLFPGSTAAGIPHLDSVPHAATSDDDEDPHFHSAAVGGSGAAKKASPWQRMKWTDDVVRLLITLVSFVGDDGAFDASAAGARKCGGALQKKGKWKTVSKLMMENGCYVSPQQCEDKFNDLNKRYKRLNEILGRGTTCQVVENPSLLDSMPHIPPKAKDDVRKILSSKHLFYREMCAYHNGQRIPNSQDFNIKVGSLKNFSGFEDGNEEEGEKVETLKNLDEFDDVEDEEEEDEDEFGKPGCDSFHVEFEGKSAAEKKEWLKKRELRLLEERVEIQAERIEIEKRWMKWEKFRSKKDLEMERLKLENEQARLENERIVLLVRQKEMELEYNRELLSVDGGHGRVQ